MGIGGKANPNLGGILICSFSFFLLFAAYQTVQARLTTVFKDLVMTIKLIYIRNIIILDHTYWEFYT